MLNVKTSRLGLSVAAALAMTLAAPAMPVAAQPQGNGYRPTNDVLLSLGEGELISLPRPVANVWTSNPDVADVQVNNPRQIGLFGKANGEATIIATASDGSIVYGARVRVSQNISSVNEALQMAMPGSDINVTHVGQIAVLNGTVASPEDSAQAEMLVRTILNPGIAPNSTEGLRILPVNRLRIATPQQVMLKVTIAEVSRSLVRDINANITTRDTTGGFQFGIGRGDPGDINIDGTTGAVSRTLNVVEGLTTIAGAGRLFGLEILGSLQANEGNGLVNILAEPTLTALSGETASFLAGGEFPIPISQSLGAVTVEYKQFGVGLAFSPIVLDNGRISMRVRPEVSELSTEGAVRINGFQVPALTTRRTETTIELGSGQSMMISGLLRNVSNSTINRVPFLGSLPIIGALFRSNGFRRAETELVIVVTPYLVQPVSSNRIALPTDGYRSPGSFENVFLGQGHVGRTENRPVPAAGPPQTVRPGIVTGQAVPVPAPVQTADNSAPARAASGARPGFDF